ncbi:hypothetical protein [Hymenobacter mucosus]|uniref:Uncharacterized protein n=1 Tax=Hymenobacter mucosus TaxID=1411120 RepID=A0A239AAD7_9BACT|nr:hypothetical protein [Hymenobacter mucosus]SNR92595.1 hypothetical protein SAMN06269173_111109 [Hymenobacter mucosus]
MARQNKKAVAAGAATVPAAVQLEPGVRFIGELLYPVARFKELNALVHWTVQNDFMGERFPVGTVLGMKPIKRRQDIVVGRVYLWALCDTYSLLRITGLRKRGILTQWDRYPDKIDPRTNLHWGHESFALYEVTHYITYGEQDAAPTNPTEVDWRENHYQKQIYEGYCAVTLQRANQPVLTQNVSAKAALWIYKILRADSGRELAVLQKRYEESIGRALVAEAKLLMEKGGENA